ncbi:uncharacterized protein Z518_05430 [Rhinocladiella mackenziei CBS 650.93]|uniref:Rhinocladiella mackenziei CBS 650.93 unplaced genomic scaffold supercont1.4, whole genome shotgun sequence n=1 Tax=Rhinocladiella mackenziei CBS 650.93 TaxID=1442369 RepID=A0A0D2J694_9EURO|nr:uncharacterized protein Z518_05430 [Rhinocladiella mackenziei CBS 650.93]KIX04560.1 hypothetical protein Z518_05430 [Rhinocladiella mackenziei CBS 650.93]
MSLFHRHESRKTFSDVDPHQWELPSHFPGRRFPISSKHPKTEIPEPSIFRDAIVPSLGNTNQVPIQYPTPGHITVHLCLLECFLKLKESVITSDQLEILDLPSYSGPSETGDSRNTPVSPEKSQRWATIVRLAVARFQIWFEKIESILRHAAAYHRYGSNSDASHAAITADYLPPLDVLLVWYAYMQHPAAYRVDNLAHSSPKLLEIPMPWEAILAVIDTKSLTYTLPVAAERLFTTTTTQSADILAYLTNPPPYSELDPNQAFSIDLASAVHDLVGRASFIPKMHALLWLRSPSLEGTLGRALAQYSALPQAIGARASAWLTRVNEDPTLELVWRTHMLYPMVYFLYSQSVFGSDVLLRSESDGSRRETTEVTPLTQIESDDGGCPCYCWTCERIRDEIPDYVSHSSMSPDAPSPFRSRLESSRGSLFPRSSRRAHLEPRSDTSPLSTLSKDQIASIKADIAFHRHVEAFRQSNPPEAALPTRPPTSRAVEKQRQEQEVKDRVGVYYGIGYTVKIVRPAVYDETTGKLLKKEKTKVTRSRHMNSVGAWGAGFMAI